MPGGAFRGIDLAGKLDGALVGLSSGVAVEDAVSEAGFAETLSELRLRLGVEEVAGMHQLVCLRGDAREVMPVASDAREFHRCIEAHSNHALVEGEGFVEGRKNSCRESAHS